MVVYFKNFCMDYSKLPYTVRGLSYFAVQLTYSIKKTELINNTRSVQRLWSLLKRQ